MVKISRNYHRRTKGRGRGKLRRNPSGRRTKSRKLTMKDKRRIYLEEKYKREFLGGSDYIDSRQRGHFRKWAKSQMW